MAKLMLMACPECDLLLKLAQPAIGEKAVCSRCGYALQIPRVDSIGRTLALSIAGLICAVPANLLPLIGVKAMGKSNDGNLWSGVYNLFHEDMQAVAVLVFLASILFPLVNITLSLLVSLYLYFNWPNPFLGHWLRWLQHLQEWAMLEIYALGIIVACVKLASMADVKIGLGLYAFVGLLVIIAMLASSLDPYLFWQRIHQLQRINGHES